MNEIEIEENKRIINEIPSIPNDNSINETSNDTANSDKVMTFKQLKVGAIIKSFELIYYFFWSSI